MNTAASRIALAFLLLASVLAFGPARADPAPADAAAFKALVQTQLDAFRRDDGPGAYAAAAPGIQRIFPSADAFLNMVRQAYPPVYRPASIAFGEIADSPAGPVARVYLTDADGNGWVALYRFEKQADGSWKISACQLLKDTAQTI